MDVEIPLTTVCSKCDRHAVAFNEKHLPLCGRHAMIFLTAPRMIAREAELREELEDEQRRAAEAARAESDIGVDPATNDSTAAPHDPEGIDVGWAGALVAILERLTAIENAFGISAQPASSPSTAAVSIVSDGSAAAGNIDRRRSDQGRRAADKRSGPNVVESSHEGSRPWASGGTR
ncbi:MAG: hypothetical protein M5U23_05765 [Acidimicrobiia bacterium]|nr:hypothetical protein [Acidimicrobiia bacterium]